MKTLNISQYYGAISVRLFDTELQKNVAKIETPDLMEYLNKKIENGQYKVAEKGKGNTLAVLTFNE